VDDAYNHEILISDEERPMQMSFDLTDDVVQQLKTIPNIDNFVNRVIKKALQNQLVINDKSSKWALLAQEIENNPTLNLDGYSEQLKKDTLEVREGFI
jgi:regulatory protein YycI of two-component signal transduction system YycFG